MQCIRTKEGSRELTTNKMSFGNRSAGRRRSRSASGTTTVRVGVVVAVATLSSLASVTRGLALVGVDSRRRMAVGELRSTAAASDIDHASSRAVPWPPFRAQEQPELPYHASVRSAHLRHVAVETEGMADVLLAEYSSYLSSSEDPFGDLARRVSNCAATREEGGRIGWVDNPLFVGNDESTRRNADVDVDGLLSARAVRALFERRPKGGDVVKIRSDGESGDDGDENDNENSSWHLVQINDLFVHTPFRDDPSSSSGTGDNFSSTVRPKLKGRGVRSSVPNMNDARTYRIVTTGCQMNVSDSERMQGVLRNDLGLKNADDDDDDNTSPSSSSTKRKKDPQPDVVLFNTCTIRDHAESKLYDALGPVAARKRRGDDVALIVAGCVAQQEGEKLMRRFPEIDLVMGPQYAGRLGALLGDVANGHRTVAVDPLLASGDHRNEPDDLGRTASVARGHDVRAWVNTITGCNERCTYCVVPGVRGVEQSRSPESVLREILDLGPTYREVTLLGQNIDAYGRDMSPRRTFAGLLRYLDDALEKRDHHVRRVRYVTSHPRYFSDRVIDAVANLDRIVECFHMPFQSGDNEVLKQMRRGYTFDSYMRIIRKIKDRAPDASICGDVIVGFPGESDAAFQRTLDLMGEVKFDNLNTFAYSPRPNTEAALWDNQIPEDVKAERLQIVQRLATTHALERSERYLDRTEEILVEDRNARNPDEVMGRTRQGRQVYFRGDLEDLKGKLVDVKIGRAHV